MVNNHVNLIGRLTADPDLRYYPSRSNPKKEIPVCSFRIAVDRVHGEGADFFSCRAVGITAKNLADYQKKGNLIAVAGTLKANPWKDKNDVTHNDVEINAESVLYLTPKGKSNDIDKTSSANESEAHEDSAAELNKLFGDIEKAADV